MTGPTRRGTGVLGGRGEDLAAAFLAARGLRILERNFRSRCGEIDIVAMDGCTLVFCEVKTRRDRGYGPPECAVTARKQRQLRRAAAVYLSARGVRDRECRFDVVAVLASGGEPEITYFRNAFYY